MVQRSAFQLKQCQAGTARLREAQTGSEAWRASMVGDVQPGCRLASAWERRVSGRQHHDAMPLTARGHLDQKLT